ncbi:MAG: hypothetical protein ACLRUO_03630 [Beduini sp.]|uniref:hypothetical protein n=2 Tax=Beduini sp. TaxID=1922300 RepID=UPI0011C7453B
MKSKGHSFSYLMELIIVIFFFVISAAVCVSLVVKAKERQEAASYLETAMSEAQSIIETMQAYPSQTPQQLFDAVKIDDGTYQLDNLIIEWSQDEFVHGEVILYYQEEIISRFPFVLGGVHDE